MKHDCIEIDDEVKLLNTEIVTEQQVVIPRSYGSESADGNETIADHFCMNDDDNTDNSAIIKDDDTNVLNGETAVSELVLIPLLSVLSLSGILSILSNMVVILAHNKHRRGMFERPILSLACVDIATGVLSTPIVFSIYYFKCKNRNNSVHNCTIFARCQPWPPGYCILFTPRTSGGHQGLSMGSP